MYEVDITDRDAVTVAALRHHGAYHDIGATFERLGAWAAGRGFAANRSFGVYYDRIGGIWMRQEDQGLFGNKWFKNLTSLALGTTLLKSRNQLLVRLTTQNLDEAIRARRENRKPRFVD